MLKFITQNPKFVIGVFTSVIALVIVLVAFGSSNKIIQPIQYNHNVHIEVVGLTCVDCHINVESMPKATIPNIEICEDCHSNEPLSDSPEEKKLIQYISEGKHVPWKQIYTVPDYVYFSHQRHVTIGDLECSNCHGNVESMTKPAPAPVWKPTMDNCISCHKQRKVTYDCLACHR